MRLRSSARATDRPSPILADRPPVARDGQAIGALLCDSGALQPAQVDDVLAAQARDGGLFGEVAVTLGLAGQGAVDRALRIQSGPVQATPAAPSIEPETAAAGDAVVAATFAMDHPMADRLREMCAALFSRSPSPADAQMVVVVADAQPGAGAGMLAADLAASSAHLGYAVLLVDANVARPQQHRLFQLPNRHGVSDMTEWMRRGETAIAGTSIGRLSLLAAGPAVDNVSETIERLGLTDQLRRVGRDYDMIVIDATAQDPAEAAAAGVGADGFVLAVRRHLTPLDAVRRTLSAFADRGVASLGLVMVA